MNPWLGIPGALVFLYGAGAALDGVISARGGDVLTGVVIALAGCALLLLSSSRRRLTSRMDTKVDSDLDEAPPT